MNDDQRLDPVAQAILDLLAERGHGKSISLNEAAQAFAARRAKAHDTSDDTPDPWRRYMNAVRQQSLHLARQGRIVILRKGKAVDPYAPFKGVVRLALPGGGGRP